MSISRNIGTFAEHIARIRSSERYYRTKNRTATFISRLPLIGGALFRAIRFVKQSLKNQIYGSNLFEELGLYYLGPVDGHDYERICLLLREAVAYGKSAVIHLHTKKGKGYPPAEEKPALYHSIAPATSKTSGDQRRFSAAVGELLCHMAEKDERLCAITAAMGDATGLETFGSRFPERYFDVGIAEEHALTFCAGLSAAGMHPVFAVYSSFLQRGYDNLIHDLALQSLPLTLCIDRAGLSGGDGPTHHGIFDVAFLSQIPDVTIVEPLTFEGLSVALEESREAKGIYAIRYPNGGEMSYPSLSRTGNDPLSPRCSYSPGESIARVIVTYGRLGTEALCARERLGDDCGVILLQRIAPYADAARELLSLLPPTAKTVLIAEEGIRVGGAAMCLRDALCELDTGDHDIRVLAVSDPFHPDAEGGSLYRSYRIDADAMVASMTQK